MSKVLSSPVLWEYYRVYLACRISGVLVAPTSTYPSHPTCPFHPTPRLRVAPYFFSTLCHVYEPTEYHPKRTHPTPASATLVQPWTFSTRCPCCTASWRTAPLSTIARERASLRASSTSGCPRELRERAESRESVSPVSPTGAVVVFSIKLFQVRR